MSRCPPPPPPPAPAPPPPSRGGGGAGAGAGAGGAGRGGSSSSSKTDRSALLGEIHKGTRLKKAVTNDRSAPIIEDAKKSPVSGGGGGGGGGIRAGPTPSTHGVPSKVKGSAQMPPQIPSVGTRPRPGVPVSPRGTSPACTLPTPAKPSSNRSPMLPPSSNTFAQNGHALPPPVSKTLSTPGPKSFGSKPVNGFGSSPPPPPLPSTTFSRTPSNANTVSRTSSAPPPPPPSGRNPPPKSSPVPPPPSKAPPGSVRAPPPPPMRR